MDDFQASNALQKVWGDIASSFYRVAGYLIEWAIALLSFFFMMLLLVPSHTILTLDLISEYIPFFDVIIIGGAFLLGIGILVGVIALAYCTLLKLTGSKFIARLVMMIFTFGLAGFIDLGGVGEAAFADTPGASDAGIGSAAEHPTLGSEEAGGSTAGSQPPDPTVNDDLQTVDGYVTEDGTKVDDYVRTEPDGIEENNLNYGEGK